MTAELVLPGLETEHLTVRKADGQWRLRRLQVVNWGGFDGHHVLELDAHSTLLSGASGTGKSTLLDAYTALMMDSNVPYNGASNSTGSGRARSAEQRNNLTYVRGLTDLGRDEVSGNSRENFLRGTDAATWSAVAATFEHDDRDRHTALRLFYAPANATHANQVAVSFAQAAGELDLRSLETFAADKFNQKRIKAHLPAIVFAPSYAQWSQRLFVRLSIGRGGDGTPAMKLLSRIQAGRTINSVDALFKEMVLEVPRTFTAAELAVEHFSELEKSKRLMETAQEQVAALSPAAAIQASLQAAQTELDLLDTFSLGGSTTSHQAGGAGAGTGPVTLWAARHEKTLLEAEAAAARREAADAVRRRAEAHARALELEAGLAANVVEQGANGGDALERSRVDIARLTEARETSSRARATLAARAPMLGAPTQEEELRSLHLDADAYLEGFPALRAASQATLDDIGRRTYPVSAKLTDVTKELTYLQGRRNLIPQWLDEARALIADHVGLNVTELPFVAELVDVRSEHEPWREAAEQLLAGFARKILVDAAHSNFRSKLDSLRLDPRIHFVLAPTARSVRSLDPTTLPGRLHFDTGSDAGRAFAGWLSEELDSAYSYVCLGAEDFGRDGRRAITINGQVRNGTKGAHGGHGARRILGFSAASRVVELEAEQRELESALAGLDAEKEAALDAKRFAEARRDACTYVLDVTWASIDVDGATAALATAQRRYDDLLAEGGDVLAVLQAAHSALKAELDEVAATRTRAADRAEGQNKLWGSLTEDEDVASRNAEALERAGVSVTASQSTRLDAERELFTSTGTAEEFIKVVLPKMRRSLGEASAHARTAVRTSSERLTQIFTAFQDRWPQPNLGQSAESYEGFQELLDALLTEGLATRQSEFTRRVIDWSSEDLLGLSGSYAESLNEITNRLAPVNDGLAALPFGPGADRLRIRMRQMRARDVAVFREQLSALASATTRIEPGEVDERFIALRAFMARIGPDSREREYLLDVRRHVHVEAERLDTESGGVLSIYDGLGGKSGGETQELVAFIVGAALRYRLGTADSFAPAYAPVLLDEAFIKADSEFAGRAVTAWQGLGFQLVIAAPLDKVSAIEPYVAEMISVVKQDSYSFTYPYRDPKASAAGVATETVPAQNLVDRSVDQTAHPGAADS